MQTGFSDCVTFRYLDSVSRADWSSAAGGGKGGLKPQADTGQDIGWTGNAFPYRTAARLKGARGVSPTLLREHRSDATCWQTAASIRDGK